MESTLTAEAFKQDHFSHERSRSVDLNVSVLHTTDCLSGESILHIGIYCHVAFYFLTVLKSDTNDPWTAFQYLVQITIDKLWKELKEFIQ